MEITILFLGVSFMFMSWLGYNSMTFSPRRMLVYMVIPMITVFARIIKKPVLYGAVVSMMIIAPPLIGTQSFVWVNDAITEPELEAIHWLIENDYFAKSEWYEWFGDRSVTQAINPHIFFYRPDKDPASASVSTTEEIERLNEFVTDVYEEYDDFLTNNNHKPSEVNDTEPITNTTTSKPPAKEYKWKYIFLSERMRKRSFYVIRGLS